MLKKENYKIISKSNHNQFDNHIFLKMILKSLFKCKFKMKID